MTLARTLSTLAASMLAAAAFAAPAVAADETSAAPAPSGDVNPSIIDGSEAESGPWAARLFQGNQDVCSASVIAPEWVLTAQHCVEGAGDNIGFNIGALEHAQGERFDAKSGGVYVHDSADLALVNIDRPTDVEVAPLGNPGDVNVGETVQVYGWGATCTDRPEGECQSPVLKVADVDVTDIACQDYRGGTAVCASRNDGITAGGDSGGPMFSGNVQVGVASTSDRQTTTAYTNVIEYRDWIQEVAGV